MAAPMRTGMSVFRKFGIFGNYCRLSRMRMQQKHANISESIKPFPKDWQMDPEVEAKCEEDPLRYPKRHPGLMVMKTLPLPSLVEKNARNMLEAQELIADTSFLAEVSHLNEVYRKRQPPPEKENRRTKMDEIADKLFQEEFEALRMRPEDLTEKQKLAIGHRVTDVTKKIYNRTTHNYKHINYEDRQAMVYMAARLAPNYRVLQHIFHEIHKLDEGFIPAQVLNVASGVGSAIWAANEIWKDNIQEYYCVDTSSYMNDLARQLIAYNKHDPLNVCIPGVNFRRFIPSEKHDYNRFPLVVSAYLLMEMPSLQDRLDLLISLWNLTHTYLVLVEHGTAAGYRLIMEARKFLLQDTLTADGEESNEGHVFAPCMHDEECPKLQFKDKPCTFSVKYNNLNLHKDFGQGTPQLEERFSYVVLKKGRRPTNTSQSHIRLTGVNKKSSHVHCELCCPDGKLRTYMVTKIKPSVHLLRCAKRCVPGDFLPCHWPENISTSHSDDSGL